MKTASIVIPTFNRAHLVHRAIESAISQTYPCEVILCDHGSTDNTEEIAKRYEGKICYIRRFEDRGPIVCWHDGIEQANGEVIHITYDDDWIEPQFMEKSIRLLRSDIGFVYTNVKIYEPDTDYYHTLFNHPANIRPMREIVMFLLRERFAISPGCAIFRRKDALKNLLLDVPNAKGKYHGAGEDLLLFLLTSLQYEKYAHINEPLACFLSHSGSITIDAINTGKSRQLAAAYQMAKEYYYLQSGSIQPPDKFKKRIYFILWKYRGNQIRKLVSFSFLRQLRWRMKSL